MLDRMIESDRSLAPETRHAYRMRDGHRREYDPQKQDERLSFRDLAVEQGLAPGQQIASGLIQRAQIVHDTAINRACERERRRLIEQGATLRRVRLDAELKSTVARRSESVRVRDGRCPAVPGCPGTRTSHRRERTRAVSRCADGVRRSRRTHRSHKYRGGLRPLQCLRHPGQGPCRIRGTRHRTLPSPRASGTGHWPRPQLHPRSGPARDPAAFEL